MVRTMVAGLVTAVVVALTPAQAQASPWVHVFIEHLPAGTCVAIADASDGTTPSQQPCVDTGYQLWTFEDVVAGGPYRIRNTATGKCLAASGTSVVHQLTCAVGTTQQWHLTGSGTTYRISNVSAGRCLARQATSPNLVLGTCVPSVALWSLLF